MSNFFENEELGEMDPIEAEIDAIRKELWEEVKDMTPDEHVAYINAKTEPIIKQFHMKVSRLEPLEMKFRPRVYENYADL